MPSPLLLVRNVHRKLHFHSNPLPLCAPHLRPEAISPSLLLFEAIWRSQPDALCQLLSAGRHALTAVADLAAAAAVPGHVTKTAQSTQCPLLYPSPSICPGLDPAPSHLARVRVFHDYQPERPFTSADLVAAAAAGPGRLARMACSAQPGLLCAAAGLAAEHPSPRRYCMISTAPCECARPEAVSCSCKLCRATPALVQGLILLRFAGTDPLRSLSRAGCRSPQLRV